MVEKKDFIDGYSVSEIVIDDLCNVEEQDKKHYFVKLRKIVDGDKVDRYYTGYKNVTTSFKENAFRYVLSCLGEQEGREFLERNELYSSYSIEKRALKGNNMKEKEKDEKVKWYTKEVDLKKGDFRHAIRNNNWKIIEESEDINKKYYVKLKCSLNCENVSHWAIGKNIKGQL